MTNPFQVAATVVGLIICLISVALGQPKVTVDPPPVSPLPSPPWVQIFDQGEVNGRLKGIQTPRGIKLEVVAQEPAVANPREMAFGDDGTLYVLEGKPPARGELKALRDQNGNSLFDESQVVMDDLQSPAGLLVDSGWFYWTSDGRVLRRRAYEAKQFEQLQALAEEKKGPPTSSAAGGKWIEQQLVRGLNDVQPFAASGLAIGPDGWLYISTGSGDNRPESWDGSRAAVLRSGAIFRMRPDGSQVHEFARGLCNPGGNVAFDGLGNVFLADSGPSEHASDFVRLVHALEGGDYGWLHARIPRGDNPNARNLARPDPVRAVATGGRPGTLPPMLATDVRASRGLLIYNGPAFPDFFQGLLIGSDATAHRVAAYAIERGGATFRVASRFDLMKGDDSFRPCHAIQGLDGAIYIATNQNRIYRLSWSGTADAPAIPLAARDRWNDIENASNDKLWSLLQQPDAAIRRRAAAQLIALGLDHEDTAARFRKRLIDLMTIHANPLPTRAAAIFAAERLVDSSIQDAWFWLLTDKNPEMVRLASEAIARHLPEDKEWFEAIAVEVKNALSHATDPIIERALRLTLARLALRGTEDAAEWNFEATSVTHGPKMSRYVFDAHVKALEMVPGAATDLMLGNLDVAINLPITEPPERQRLKEFVTLTAEAMRTRELSKFLDALFRGEEDFAAKMEGGLVVRLITSYQNVLVDPPINADALAEWLDKRPDGPTEVELAVLETLSIVGTTKADSVTRLADRLLAKPETALLVGRSVIAGQLDRDLLPRIKDALRRHADGDKSKDAAQILKEVIALENSDR